MTTRFARSSEVVERRLAVTIEGMPARSWLPPAPAGETGPGRSIKVLRYASGSVVATVCSELTFVVVYGPLHVGPAWSSFLAWLAGAVPNYWLNRSWTWQRQGRPSLRHEILPYLVIIGLTLLLATLVTRAVDAALTNADIASSARVVLVAGAFLGVYAVMFVLRFFLLDRMFARLARLET